MHALIGRNRRSLMKPIKRMGIAGVSAWSTGISSVGT